MQFLPVFASTATFFAGLIAAAAIPEVESTIDLTKTVVNFSGIDPNHDSFVQSLEARSAIANIEPNPSSITKRALNPDRERAICYHHGHRMDRIDLVTAVDDFCNNRIGRWFPAGHFESLTYSRKDGSTIIVEFRSICGWTLDNNCYRLFRGPIDDCNTGGVNGKQGGTVEERNPNCGWWRVDPQGYNSPTKRDELPVGGVEA